MKRFVVEAYGNRMCIIEAVSLEAATRQALRDEGRANVDRVREATDDDVAWWRCMSGAATRGKP